MNPLRRPGRPGRIDGLLETEANESGAVALGIVLAYHRHYLGLTKLKYDCGVTRDGTTVRKLLAAAALHGLQGTVQANTRPQDLQDLQRAGRLPAITIRDDNRYQVVLRCSNWGLDVFDTARGRLRLQPDQLQARELLVLVPGPDFKPFGKPDSIWDPLVRLLWPLKGELTLLVLIASATVVPLLMIAGCTSQFIDAFLQQQRFSFGIPIAWLVLIAVIMGLLLNLFQDLLVRRLEYVLTRSFAADIFELAFSADYTYYLQRRSAEIAARLNFSMYIPNLVISQFSSACLGLWTGILLVIFSSLISPILFALLLSGFILAIAYNTWISIRLSTNNHVLTAENNKAAATGVQAITNIESIKSSGLEFSFLRDWQDHYLESIRQRQIVGKQLIKSALSVNGSTFAITAILLGIGGLLIIHGSLSLGALLAFLFLQSQINNAIYQIPNISNSWQQTQGMMRCHHGLLAAPRDPYVRAFARISDLPIETEKLPGTIDLVGVNYAFSPVDDPYLVDLNIRVAPGEHLALVGSSGSGKSTIIRMLAGFYRPSAGQYFVGGKEWLSTADSTIRNSLSYVPQDVFVFNATFEDNIKLWRPGYGHADVVAAAQAANLHDEIMCYSESYNTLLKDNGTNISGGQRQRLEIARSLIKQPTILLLDEATSALDNKSEEHVLSAVKQLGITVVSVAHRLNAALHSDQVIVLEQGKVLEQGHPQELLDRQGAFHRLVMAEAALGKQAS
jgi:ATP-binding cassette subfamily B protein